MSEYAERLQEELLRTAEIFMGEDTHEVRTLASEASDDSGWYPTTSTLVKTPQEALQAILGASESGQSVYLSMNPVNAVPAKDSDVPRFKWLGVDIDSREGQSPRLEAEGIKLYLKAHGFPEPVVGFSGRGVWLLYKCAMPNDNVHRKLRQRFLRHLHELDGGSSVDVSVFNASRVMRFFGTMNPRGSRSRLWSVPSEIIPVDTAIVEALLPPTQEAVSKAPTENVLPLTGQSTPYGDTALQNRIQELRNAKPGTRNNALTATCRRLRELVDSQQVDYEWALAQLWEVSEEIGLTDGEELSHTRTTIIHNFENYERDSVEDAGLLVPILAKGNTERIWDKRVWDDWEEQVPDIEWLIHKRLGRGTLVWAYGSKEVGKSLYFLGIAKSLTDRGEVVSFYSEEMPRSLDVRRITRLGIQKGNFRWKNGRGLNLADKQQLQTVIDENDGTSLIILDSYERVWQSSTRDENRRAVEFAKAIHRVIAETGATVVVIDHTGFGYRDDNGVLHEERKPRGASAKEQQADMSLLISTRERWDGGKVFRFDVENMKPGRLENPFIDKCEIRDTVGGGIEVVVLRESSALTRKVRER